jgi:predicted RNase H-like HicB family nuclease
MAKYAYPAIFTPEGDGSYSINFPDLEGCYTCGDSLEDGIEMAEDALALVLYGYEKDGREIPAPSAADAIALNGNEFVNYIACDTIAYRKMYNNKAVKKTLTIPEWLNEAAASMGLNFSQVLQEALIQKVQAK